MDFKDIRNLQEAYLEVYQEIDEEQSPIPRGTPMNKRWPYISNKDPEFQTALDRVNKKKSKKKDVSAESYDIYDIILSHLLDEGYAETPEAAEKIMVNMSEEWKQNILEADERPENINSPAHQSRDTRSDRQKRMAEFGSARLRAASAAATVKGA